MPQAPTRIIYFEIYWKAMKIPARVNKCVIMQSRYIEAAEEVLGERNRRKDPG